MRLEIITREHVPFLHRSPPIQFGRSCISRGKSYWIDRLVFWCLKIWKVSCTHGWRRNLSLIYPFQGLLEVPFQKEYQSVGTLFRHVNRDIE
jgi:hypothetical protein